ncbi:MAG: MarR family transcriptional regulator [Clostridiales bacterium]|jgi:DNA-binding MarR family transcriptional regulator|nr:MarR family transcriptional regulator [Clostridiales bacterium]
MRSGTCGMLIKQIYDAIGKQANNALRKNDLTLSQVRLLMELGEDGGAAKSLKELERRFQVAQPTISGIVRRSEAKGLVHVFTSSEDNRVKLVKLTPEGEALQQSNMCEIEKMECRLVLRLTEEEQQELLRMLHIVYNNIK